jgi:hypothetical protein
MTCVQRSAVYGGVDAHIAEFPWVDRCRRRSQETGGHHYRVQRRFEPYRRRSRGVPSSDRVIEAVEPVELPLRVSRSVGEETPAINEVVEHQRYVVC